MIVYMDENEDIYTKSIRKALVGNKNLYIREAVGNLKVGVIFFRSKKLIDGVWTTVDVAITEACMVLTGFDIGDHRLFVLEFLMSSLVQQNLPKIARAAGRSLRLKSYQQNYLERFEDLISEHKIIERVGTVNDKSTPKAMLKIELDTINKNQGNYMLNTENKCREIRL